MKERIEDRALIELLSLIVSSFRTITGKGLPLGNLTSQLLVNIYLDPLDKFIKRTLKANYYLRYADDFIILSADPNNLLGYFIEVNQFLQRELRLSLHKNKIHWRKLTWGIDFVGYVALHYYTLPRRRTVQRIVRKLIRIAKSQPKKIPQSFASYRGYLKHVSAYRLSSNLGENINLSS